MKTAVCVCVRTQVCTHMWEPKGQKGQNLEVWVQRQLAPTLLPVQSNTGHKNGNYVWGNLILVTDVVIIVVDQVSARHCCLTLFVNPSCLQLSAEITIRHLRISSDLEYYSRR